MDGPAFFLADLATLVDGATQNVHDPAQGLGAHGHGNRFAGVGCFQATLEAFGAAHGDGTNNAVTQLLLDFQSCFATFKQQCVIYVGNGVTWKFHVDNRANDLNDVSATHARFLVISIVNKTSRIVPDQTAVAPLTISEISWVMAA